MGLTSEIRGKLEAFFPAKHVCWKPQATNREDTKALAVAYIDARTVMRRLSDATNGDWEFHWEPDGEYVKGSLTVCGVTREDVGEMGDGPQGKTRKAAVSDALKRCAVHFGVGQYLYYLPAQWVAYDKARKRLVETPRLPSWALPNIKSDNPLDEAAPEAHDEKPVVEPSDGQDNDSGQHDASNLMERIVQARTALDARLANPPETRASDVWAKKRDNIDGIEERVDHFQAEYGVWDGLTTSEILQKAVKSEFATYVHQGGSLSELTLLLEGAFMDEQGAVERQAKIAEKAG